MTSPENINFLPADESPFQPNWIQTKKNFEPKMISQADDFWLEKLMIDYFIFYADLLCENFPRKKGRKIVVFFQIVPT